MGDTYRAHAGIWLLPRSRRPAWAPFFWGRGDGGPPAGNMCSPPEHFHVMPGTHIYVWLVCWLSVWLADWLELMSLG
jgi:hypothetical protein